MFRTALSMTLALAAVSCPEPLQAAAGERVTPVAKQHPGYGVVQSVTPLPARRAEESASAGGSSPPEAAPRQYLIRVKLDDGSIQVRNIRKPAFAPGERVFITNAGDVVPE